jgi:succinate-semialdehyde dehydrogenase/glutarate-semialdehyde dehydrogenase
MTIARDHDAASFPIVNPATCERVATHAGHSDPEVASILESVPRAAREWAASPPGERARRLRRIAVALREEAGPLAQLVAVEMGKPIAQGVSEIRKSADNCDFYAEHGAAFLSDESGGLERGIIRYQPLGTVLAIMPWNFPIWQVMRCAAPVLMAGNTMVLKHASNVMGTAIAIERVIQSVMEEAGLPVNVFRTLRIRAGQVEAVIRHPAVSAVTLTGSEAAGRAVMAIAGAELKPAVLELGGSDPFLVLEDADLDEAAKVGAWARNQNAGQSCIAAKRFIIVDSAYDEFVGKFRSHVEALRVGDPLEEDTQVGPMARLDLRDELHDQVERSVEAGARVLAGGRVPERAGAWYPPTVLADVRPGHAAFEEETFGPVAALVRVRDEAEALELANRSRFGLGASVWTRDAERGRRLASRIESGMVFVNSMPRSDPRLPFGGIKASGFGRELWVPGIRSFANAKTVYSES